MSNTESLRALARSLHLVVVEKIKPRPVGFIDAPDCLLTKGLRNDGLKDAVGEWSGEETGY